MDDYDDARGPVWPILLAVGAIVVFIVGVIWFLWSSFFGDLFLPQGETSFPVPDLQGMTMAEIRQDPEIMDKFIIEEGDLVASEEFDAGQVVRQEPEAETMVKGDGQVITVYLSSGGSEMEIPPVENMERRRAKELLQDRMGLVVTEEFENSDITKDYAIRTDLPVGTAVKKGDRVTLVVSNGPEIKTVEVIDFTNQKLETAKKQIEDMDLVVGNVTEDPTDAVEPGMVTWQNIPASTSVVSRTAIDLRVSVAPMENSAPPSGHPSAEPSGHPSTQPSAQPSTPVTQPPASQPPVESQKPAANRAIFVHLPASAEGKTQVQVRIEVDGQVKYDSPSETSLFPISPLVKGQGTQEVSVYVDGALVDQYMETFS